MDRRTLVGLMLAAPLALRPSLGAAASPPNMTRWSVRASEGLDALAFLNALTGAELYREYYAADIDEFSARLPQTVRTDIEALATEATKSGFGLLGPNLSNLMSGTDISTLRLVITALASPEVVLRPSYQASAYWSEQDWRWLVGHASRLRVVLEEMDKQGFATFRQARIGAIEARVATVAEALSSFDVVKWQTKLTGRTFDPLITIVLLHFSKPHGAKLQGQVFMQAADYDTATTVRIAAHEMLHPPFPMDGAAAKSALAVLNADPLMTRIAKDHDPRWGYTSVAGLLNEDMCEALDQLISEALGVARNPADRWRKSDDGIHVLAAGLYGLLRDDHWIDTGGDIAAWITRAVQAGRLAPASLHPIAARVLERPVDRLWPLAG